MVNKSSLVWQWNGPIRLFHTEAALGKELFFFLPVLGSFLDFYLFRLCTMWVNVVIGIRSLGFLDNCSACCQDTCPHWDDRPQHVLSTEYKCPSLRPAEKEGNHVGVTIDSCWVSSCAEDLAVFNPFLPVGLTVSAASAQRSPRRPLCCEQSLSRLCSTNSLKEWGIPRRFSFSWEAQKFATYLVFRQSGFINTFKVCV